MVKFLGLASLVVLVSGLAWGDSIVLSGSESLVNMPISITNPGFGSASCGVLVGAPGGSFSQCGFLGYGPYWDNDSEDGAKMNVGYMVTGSCGIPASCTTNYGPSQFLSGSSAMTGLGPTSIILSHTSPSAVVTLLGGISGTTSDQFGYYNVSNPSVLHPILGPNLSADVGQSVSLTSVSGNYGFYLQETGGVTLYSNASLNSCGIYTPSDPSCSTTDQHFAIFTSTTPGIFYIGVEDWGLLGGTSGNGEGNGDANDVLFELNTANGMANQTTVPEPATFGLVGATLLGLSIARKRTLQRA